MQGLRLLTRRAASRAALRSSLLDSSRPRWTPLSTFRPITALTTRRYCASVQPDLIDDCQIEKQTPSSRKILMYTPAEFLENADLFTSVSKGDPEVEKTLRILCLEHDVMSQEAQEVPEKMSLESFETLLQLDSRRKRLKFYHFLFIKQIKKQNETARKKQRNAAWMAEKDNMKEQEEDNGHIRYGLQHNSIFLRIYEETITNFHNSRLFRGMQLDEQKLFFDLGFENSMSPHEVNNLAKQLLTVFAENRKHQWPFDLHFCNAPRSSLTMRKLFKSVPTLYNDNFPLNLHSQHYLDLVPKEKLVYLTPHCREVMHEFDHEAVYIVGGIVDKSNTEPLTLAKAKREGLRMAKLPLDDHLHWAGSSKSLTLDQMVKILLDLRLTKDWQQALSHVPRRKLKSDEEFLSTPAFSRKNNPFARKKEAFFKRPY